jgi:hypothetical protein
MATWKIKAMERNLSDGGVFLVHWTVVEEEEVQADPDPEVPPLTYHSRKYGSCSFTPDPSAADFVAYDDLTEATVLGWVHEYIGADEKAAIETRLTAEVAEQKTPTKGKGMPW